MVSQGSAATSLRYGGIRDGHFVAKFCAVSSSEIIPQNRSNLSRAVLFFSSHSVQYIHAHIHLYFAIETAHSITQSYKTSPNQKAHHKHTHTHNAQLKAIRRLNDQNWSKRKRSQ